MQLLLFIMYEHINNTMYTAGEDGSCTYNTDSLHIAMCCLVFKIFSIRTNWQFFSANESDVGYLLLY